MHDYTVDFLYKGQLKKEWIEATTMIQAIYLVTTRYEGINPPPGFNYDAGAILVISCNLQTPTPELKQFYLNQIKH